MWIGLAIEAESITVGQTVELCNLSVDIFKETVTVNSTDESKVIVNDHIQKTELNNVIDGANSSKTKSKFEMLTADGAIPTIEEDLLLQTFQTMEDMIEKMSINIQCTVIGDKISEFVVDI